MKKTITRKTAKAPVLLGFWITHKASGLVCWVPASKHPESWEARCFVAKLITKGLTTRQVLARKLTAKAVWS